MPQSPALCLYKRPPQGDQQRLEGSFCFGQDMCVEKDRNIEGIYSADLQVAHNHSRENPVLHVARAFSLIHQWGRNFFHNMIEVLPAFFSLAAFLAEDPGLPVLMRGTQVRSIVPCPSFLRSMQLARQFSPEPCHSSTRTHGGLLPALWMGSQTREAMHQVQKFLCFSGAENACRAARL